MNYGYDCDRWKIDRKVALFNALVDILSLDRAWTPAWETPYLELDGLYPGVRIRRITHLTEAAREDLVERADRIYRAFTETKSDGSEA